MYIAIANSIGSSSNSGGTPVPPPVVYVFYLQYSNVSVAYLCDNLILETEIYSLSSTLNVGSQIFYDIELTSTANEGFYKNGNEVYYLNEGGGYIAELFYCSERYYVNDCSSQYGTFISVAYPTGTFIYGDMVTFETGQGAGFGFITDFTYNEGDEIEITAIGVNQGGNCFTSNIAFNPILIADSQNILLRLQGGNSGPENLASMGLNALNYTYNIQIYYESDNSSGNLYVSGDIPISTYNLAAEDTFNLGDFVIYNDPEDSFNYVVIENIISSITFNNTIAYSNNDGCSFPFFLREAPEVKTYYCYTQNDDC